MLAFLAHNLATILVAAVIFGGVAAVLLRGWRNLRSGRHSCSGCSGCSGCCHCPPAKKS